MPTKEPLLANLRALGLPDNLFHKDFASDLQSSLEQRAELEQRLKAKDESDPGWRERCGMFQAQPAWMPVEALVNNSQYFKLRRMFNMQAKLAGIHRQRQPVLLRQVKPWLETGEVPKHSTTERMQRKVLLLLDMGHTMESIRAGIPLPPGQMKPRSF